MRLAGVLFFFSSVVFATSIPNHHLKETQNLEAWLDRVGGHSRKANPTPGDHVLHPDAASAIAWAKTQKAVFAAGMGAEKFDVLEASDPRHPVLQRYVHELWQAFGELFPSYVKGLNEPPVVLVDSEVVNAFVAQDPTRTKISHAVIVLTGLIDSAGGIDKKEAITGIIAHELAHSVFRHLLPKYQAGIDKFYKAKDERVGFRAKRAPDLDEVMKGWLEASKLVGDLTGPELADLPSKGIAVPVYGKLWNQIQSDLFDGSGTCDRARHFTAEWTNLMPVSMFANQVGPLTKPPLEVATWSAVVIAQQQLCIDRRKAKLFDLVAKVTGVPAEVLAASEEMREIARKFDSAEDPIQGLRALVQGPRESMRQVENSVNLAELGSFTHEEHADDISLIVHKYLGWDPAGLAKFFFALLNKSDAEAGRKCVEHLKLGALPPPGAFSDPHRAICYRVAHLRDLNELIDKSGNVAKFAKDYVNATLPH